MFYTENYHPDLAPIENYECPNCWGYSQWDGEHFVRTESIDKGSNLEIFSKNGFIRRFVKKYIG